MAQICSFKLSANLGIFLYAILQMHFQDKALLFRRFLILENEKWQTVDLTGSWNYASSSSPCWEVRSCLRDAVRDVQDFWTKMGYQVLNSSKKILITWNTSGYHHQYNGVDLVRHISHLCNYERLHLKSIRLVLHIHVINCTFQSLVAWSPYPSLRGEEEGQEERKGVLSITDSRAAL